MSILPLRKMGDLASACLLLSLASAASGQELASSPAMQPEQEAVVLPPSVPDPLEPFNRAVWGFNKGLLSGVIEPTSKVYRFVVIKPIRNGIGHFGKNLTYPGRLINNMLQGKWKGARDESYRFIFNTTFGLAGFIDIADKKRLPKSEADFGQTFGHWGWKPGCFIMLPIFWPSNERDTLGLACDTAANHQLYIAPYELEIGNPLTYLGPYTYFTYGGKYNDLADTVRDLTRFSRVEMDPYSLVQYAWTFARESQAADFQLKGKKDAASLETIESTFFTFQDLEFSGRGRTRSVLIPSTGRKLKFTYWLQPGKAPVVYLAPGLGAHRLSRASLALAELIFKTGCSAVCVSSVYHSEFMENASTANMPAYVPVDGHDLHVALTEIDHRLNTLHPERLGEKALMGYSMGALHALFIAFTGPQNRPSLIPFSRCVAIDTPVRLLHGMGKLDEFYRAPLDWPEAERAANIKNTLLKAAEYSRSPLAPGRLLNFSSTESQFLIGMSFRLTLRDIIYSSQRRNNQGVLQHPIAAMRRDPLHQEILRYSYLDYFEKFVIPYYRLRRDPSPTGEAIEKAGDLRIYESGLRANPGIRIIVNQNDFLLAEQDLRWLHHTFPPGN